MASANRKRVHARREVEGVLSGNGADAGMHIPHIPRSLARAALVQ